MFLREKEMLHVGPSLLPLKSLFTNQKGHLPSFFLLQHLPFFWCLICM